MTKECEICGRHIKSGWKYCWEHRNSSGATYSGQRLNEDMLIYEATEAFKKDFINDNHNFKLEIISKGKEVGAGILLLVLGYSFMRVFPTISGIFGLIGVILIIHGFFKNFLMKRALKIIKNKDEEYVSFVKEDIRNRQEEAYDEETFRRSLFNQKFVGNINRANHPIRFEDKSKHLEKLEKQKQKERALRYAATASGKISRGVAGFLGLFQRGGLARALYNK